MFFRNTKYICRVISNNQAFTKIYRQFLTANFPELEKFPKEIKNYESLHKFSIEHSETFWSTLANSRLDWFKSFDKVKEGDFDDKLDNFKLKWFINGKLNASGNKKNIKIGNDVEISNMLNILFSQLC